MWWVSTWAFIDRSPLTRPGEFLYRFAFKLTLVVRFAEVSPSINVSQGLRSRDCNQAIRLHNFLLA